MINIKLNKKKFIVFIISVSFFIKLISYIALQEFCLISVEKKSLKNDTFSEKFISENVHSNTFKKLTLKKISNKIKSDYNNIKITIDEFRFIIYFTNLINVRQLGDFSYNFIILIHRSYRAPPQY